jgi:hypothetical protein
MFPKFVGLTVDQRKLFEVRSNVVGTRLQLPKQTIMARNIFKIVYQVVTGHNSGGLVKNVLARVLDFGRQHVAADVVLDLT